MHLTVIPLPSHGACSWEDVGNVGSLRSGLFTASPGLSCSAGSEGEAAAPGSGAACHAGPSCTCRMFAFVSDGVTFFVAVLQEDRTGMF